MAHLSPACFDYDPELDREGIHWIIEAKAERGKDDEEVAAKRQAAEALVQRLAAEDAFAGQCWGYLIGFESDIKQAPGRT